MPACRPALSLARRPMLALALCGWLSACGGSPQAPVPTAPQPTPRSATPAPTPTLALSQTAVALRSGEAVSLKVTTSARPDRVDISGVPAGLTAQLESDTLRLQAQDTAPGQYTLTLTGVWGQVQSRASVQVTVSAPASAPVPTPVPLPAPVPTPAPTPTPVAPDFSLSLPAQVTLMQGQGQAVALTLSRSAGLSGDIQLSAVSAPAQLRVGLSGEVLNVDAAQAPAGRYVVTVVGTAAGLARQGQMVVDVTEQPAQVSAVNVSADVSTLQAGDVTTLRSSVSGSGAYNPAVRWQVQSSAGVQATLQEAGDGTARLSVASTSAAGQVRVLVSSVQDASRSAELVLTVKAAPQTVSVSVPQGGVSLNTGGSSVLSYQGSVRSVELATTPLISRAELQNVTAQGGEVRLTSGTQSGSGTVSLTFNMTDGSRHVLSFPVQVTVPTPPAPAPAPTPAPSSGYVWYPESDRSADAAELEVLRLTNDIRAKGATCGGTAYAPAPPLKWNDRLAHAARNHALDMGKRSYFEHTTPEGVRFSERVTAAGYAWQTVGENIAAGYATPASVVDGWLKSPGHCVNLMNPAFTELGVGRAQVSGSPYSLYWGQSFGAPQ
ncbi:CAP domain-containing protein [Deinococcus sp. VB142]|uniref:CAP domain-containing protein n=1 Tax=Deinococcus sp. VB142 TaxID=3112952 RepID=A0AAU6Q485_9DEIO